MIFDATKIDAELIHDFSECLEDSLESIEHGLIRLEHDPADPEIINSLFRDIHNITGNCQVCALEPLGQLSRAIEDVFSEMRTGNMKLSELMREALLLTLDQLRVAGETVIQTRQLDVSLLSELTPNVIRLSTQPASLFEQAAADIITLISTALSVDLTLENISTVISHTAEDRSVQNENGDEDADLVFFHILAKQVDLCSPHRQGRCEINQETALTINFFLKEPVNHDQLIAACYIHDIGMAFLPEGLINKQDKLDNLEEKQMQMHTMYATEWLNRIGRWEQAAEMVYQHHERPDGQGYPLGLKGDEICQGAKILAITDAFFAITNTRSDRSYKKSVLRAVTEINNYMHTQFDEITVCAFNEMIRKVFIQKKDKVA